MDDFAKSVASEKEVLLAQQDLRTSLKPGGFNLLVKWICTSKTVSDDIIEEDRSDASNKKFEAEPLTSSLQHFSVSNGVLKMTC